MTVPGTYNDSSIELMVPAKLTMKQLNSFCNKGIRFKKLKKVLQEAIRLNPQYSGLYNEMRALLSILDPNDPQTYKDMGILLSQKGSLEAAITNFQRATELNPNDPQTHFNLGVMLEQKGQLEDALASYQTALEIDPNFAEAYINIGVVFGKQGQGEKAIANLQRSIEINPNIAESYYN